MIDVLPMVSRLPLLALGADEKHDTAAHGVEVAANLSNVYALIPFLPLFACIFCGLCAARNVKSKLPAYFTIALLGLSFILTIGLYRSLMGGESMAGVIHAFNWINFEFADGRSMVANFSFYVDPLTCLWMLFVTGLATLIALYASEYMEHDQGLGYCRFFAAFGLFVFSMACLVMGDNLLLLFLGWEGVGLCSYLLIGYFYKKPSAVAASKKAFVMNRIGDFGLVLGVMLTFVHFGTFEYAKLFGAESVLIEYMQMARDGNFADIPLVARIIPFLLMIGAFGKSAQLPLYVWLPDAMEGPTPVSALIHAATMVTAGVYMIARTIWIFEIGVIGVNPEVFGAALLPATIGALPVVAWVGALTALLAATIGMSQFDIKRIMAYSTVSQLGYMFAGLGVMGSVGAAWHVFTHAFFKATLFLCCGAVMHGFAGQLDLRKLSGVGWMKGWGIVGIAMLIGCLNLAGVPFITAGFYSKDTIIADTFIDERAWLGFILLVTAALTAYYTFRVFFRVFVGPVQYEPGDEVHDHDHDHDDAHDHAHDDHGHEGGFHPHAPGWAINTVLAILAVASVLAIGTKFIGEAKYSGWVGDLVGASTASIHSAHHGTFLGMDAHTGAMIASIVVSLGGILVAFYMHYIGRTDAATSNADDYVPLLGPIAGWARAKWLVDELYDFVIVKPLWVLSHLMDLIDKWIVDGLVNGVGLLPKGFAMVVRRTQSGILHDYALRMAAGIGAILLIAMWMVR